jgi:hypothetical protein
MARATQQWVERRRAAISLFIARLIGVSLQRVRERCPSIQV